jgi:hypothetical protein
MDAGRVSTATEIEAQGADAFLPCHLRGPHDDGIVHVAAVERVRVAEDETGPATLNQPEAPLEPYVSRDLDAHTLFQADLTSSGRYPSGGSPHRP